MTNALANFHATSAVASVEDLNAKLLRGRQNLPKAPGGGDTLLRIDQNDGLFVFGPDNVIVEEGSLWAVDSFEFRTGFVCWADPKLNGRKNEKLGEKMGPADDPIDMPNLPDAWAEKGGKWVEQVAFDLFCVSGEDEGQKVTFSNSSGGAIKAYGDLYVAVLDRPDLDHCFPIVELVVGSYMNKTYNKRIYEPNFEVRDWCDKEQNLLSAQKGGKKSTEKVAAKLDTSKTTDVEEDAAPEVAEEEQTRRRRVRRND